MATVKVTKYCIDDEEYSSLQALRRAHKELIFSNKASDEVLGWVGITKKTEEKELPDNASELVTSSSTDL